MGKTGKKIKKNLGWFAVEFLKWSIPLFMQKGMAEIGRVLTKLGKK